MADVRMQLTSRTGKPGTVDAVQIGHGDWPLYPFRITQEFTRQLADVMEAAHHVARDGLVTEVSILVYPEHARQEAIANAN